MPTVAGMADDAPTITLNGDPRPLAAGTTVRGLLAAMGLSPDKVAVERNRRLVRAADYDATLEPGDEVEVVTFVGGG